MMANGVTKVGFSMRALLLAGMSIVAMASVACGSSDEGTSSGTGGSETGKLSQAFKTNCARCHGPDGQGMGKYPKLPGDVSSEAAFIAQVRSGSPNTDPPMDAYTAAQISDEDLKNDWAYLSTRP